MNRLSYLWVALVLFCFVSRQAEADPPQAVAPLDSNQAKTLQKAWANNLGVPVQITDSVGMKFNLIPPGEFLMGSPKSELGRDDDETQHLVKITKAFYLGAHEVTQEQYERVMGDNPSRSKDAAKPVEMVTWNDAVAFCGKLSDQEGDQYRLPTEAEWEYAYRAGTTTAYSFGDDESQLHKHAWFNANSDRTTHPVGKKIPNGWGLFDMHGNVYEWYQDWYAPYGNEKVASDPTGPARGDARVLRGGAFPDLPRNVRAADRLSHQPDYRNYTLGFRVARTIPISP